MGLFGKKIPDGIRVVFYEGDLEGFQCNFASQLLLMDDVLRITKINPYVEARLDRNRISSIDIFSEFLLPLMSEQMLLYILPYILLPKKYLLKIFCFYLTLLPHKG